MDFETIKVIHEGHEETLSFKKKRGIETLEVLLKREVQAMGRKHPDWFDKLTTNGFDERFDLSVRLSNSKPHRGLTTSGFEEV